MTGAEFRTHRAQASLSQAACAHLLGVYPSTVTRWESDKHPIPAWAGKAIEKLAIAQWHRYRVAATTGPTASTPEDN